MAQIYYPEEGISEFNGTSFMTDRGIQKLADCMKADKTITITHVAVGDGNGKIWVPERSDTRLINEVWRGTAKVVGDPDNKSIVYASSVIPVDVGGFSVREIAAFDSDGDMLAICNMPGWPKIKAVNGIQNDMEVGIVFAISNDGVINFICDPNVITATIFDIHKHNSDPNAHPELHNEITTEINTAISNITNNTNGSLFSMEVDGGYFA